jgi:hypothetical protein
LGQKARVKKLGIRTVVAAWAYFALVSIHDFATSDPVGYFRHRPGHLFYIAAIAVAGGLAIMGFHMLSLRARRRVRIFGWGAAAGVATATSGFFVFAFVSLASNGWGVWRTLSMFLAVSLAFSILAAYFWFACRRVWKRERNWTERGPAIAVGSSDITDRPRRPVLSSACVSAAHENLKTIRFEGELLPNWARLLDLAARLSPVSEDARHWFSTLTTCAGVDDATTVIEYCRLLRGSIQQHRDSIADELRRSRDDVQPSTIIGAWLYALDTMIQQAESRKTCSWVVEGAQDVGIDDSDGGDITLRRV